jgi:hypothetical protein
MLQIQSISIDAFILADIVPEPYTSNLAPPPPHSSPDRTSKSNNLSLDL